MGIIYKATDLSNGKVYIGRTIVSIESRKYEHIRDAYTNRDKMYFHRAIRKRGPDNFHWEVLCEAPSKEELNLFETFYIISHHSHKSEGGYNLTWGGEGGTHCVPHTAEGKKHMSENHADVSGPNNPMYGKKRVFSEEWKRKIGEANQGEKNPMYGKRHSDETRIKMKQAWERRRWASSTTNPT